MEKDSDGRQIGRLAHYAQLVWEQVLRLRREKFYIQQQGRTSKQQEQEFTDAGSQTQWKETEEKRRPFQQRAEDVIGEVEIERKHTGRPTWNSTSENNEISLNLSEIEAMIISPETYSPIITPMADIYKNTFSANSIEMHPENVKENDNGVFADMDNEKSLKDSGKEDMSMFYVKGKTMGLSSQIPQYSTKNSKNENDPTSAHPVYHPQSSFSAQQHNGPWNLDEESAEMSFPETNLNYCKMEETKHRKTSREKGEDVNQIPGISLLPQGQAPLGEAFISTLYKTSSSAKLFSGNGEKRVDPIKIQTPAVDNFSVNSFQDEDVSKVYSDDTMTIEEMNDSREHINGSKPSTIKGDMHPLHGIYIPAVKAISLEEVPKYRNSPDRHHAMNSKEMEEIRKQQPPRETLLKSEKTPKYSNDEKKHRDTDGENLYISGKNIGNLIDFDNISNKKPSDSGQTSGGKVSKGRKKYGDINNVKDYINPMEDTPAESHRYSYAETALLEMPNFHENNGSRSPKDTTQFTDNSDLNAQPTGKMSFQNGKPTGAHQALNGIPCVNLEANNSEGGLNEKNKRETQHGMHTGQSIIPVVETRCNSKITLKNKGQQRKERSDLGEKGHRKGPCHCLPCGGTSDEVEANTKGAFHEKLLRKQDEGSIVKKSPSYFKTDRQVGYLKDALSGMTSTIFGIHKFTGRKWCHLLRDTSEGLKIHATDKRYARRELNLRFALKTIDEHLHQILSIICKNELADGVKDEVRAALCLLRGMIYETVELSHKSGTAYLALQALQHLRILLENHQDKAEVRLEEHSPQAEQQLGDSLEGHKQSAAESPNHQQQPGGSSDHQQQLVESSDQQQQLGESSDHQQQLGESSDHQQQLGESFGHQQQPGKSLGYHQQTWESFGHQQQPVESFDEQQQPGESSGHQQHLRDSSDKSLQTEESIERSIGTLLEPNLELLSSIRQYILNEETLNEPLNPIGLAVILPFKNTRPSPTDTTPRNKDFTNETSAFCAKTKELRNLGGKEISSAIPKEQTLQVCCPENESGNYRGFCIRTPKVLSFNMGSYRCVGCREFSYTNYLKSGVQLSAGDIYDTFIRLLGALVSLMLILLASRNHACPLDSLFEEDMMRCFDLTHSGMPTY